MLFAWHTLPVAPWQDKRWLAEMRRNLRPSAYARMITNEFVSSESRFVDLAAWDACVRPACSVGCRHNCTTEFQRTADKPKSRGTLIEWMSRSLLNYIGPRLPK
jgi:hypothetical protein